MQLTAFTGCSSDLTSFSTYASRRRHRRRQHRDAPMTHRCSLESPDDFYFSVPFFIFHFYLFFFSISDRESRGMKCTEKKFFFFFFSTQRGCHLFRWRMITTSFINKKSFTDKRIFIVSFITIVLLQTRNLICATLFTASFYYWRFDAVGTFGNWIDA